VSGHDESPHRRALADLSRDNPEWSVWLEVLGAAIERAEDSSWGDVELVFDPSRPADCPLLAGATLSVDGRALERWVDDLLVTAARNNNAVAPLLRSRRRRTAWDPVGFVEAAVSHQQERIDGLATAAGVPGELMRGLTTPVAMPLLRACARIAGNLPDAWDHGYCPLCGAWPVLAEARGLEGSRQLRCGRCGGDWRFDWLRCPYCRNAEHTSLGALVSEVAGDMRKVETCHVCQGYLKTVTTLTARAPADVVVEDAATVAYDVAAIEAGFARPAKSGHPLGARVEARRRSGLLGFRR
jgi:FdhE protein